MVGISKPSRKAIKLRPAIISTIIFFSQYLVACSVENQPIVTVAAKLGTVTERLQANGVVDAVTRVNIGPVRSGIVKRIYKQEGDMVRKGEVLAEMDEEGADERLRELTLLASIERNAMARAKEELARDQALEEQGAISRDDLRKRQVDYEVKLLSWEAATQRKAQYEEEISDLTIYAPFDGIVTRKYAEVGSFVAPTSSGDSGSSNSQSILELSSGLKIIADVAQPDSWSIRKGQNGIFELLGSKESKYNISVATVPPRARRTSSSTVYVPIESKLIDPDTEGLLIGMIGDVYFERSTTKPTTTIPTFSIIKKKGEDFALIKTGEDKLILKKIKTGYSAEGRTQVLEGIEPGELVVIRASQNVLRRSGAIEKKS